MCELCQGNDDGPNKCEFGNAVFHLLASIGMSVYPDDGTLGVDLIARADEAMYRAKRMGFGSFSF